MSDYQMAVSPTGKLYLMEKKKLLWSFQDKVAAYEHSNPNQVSSYMNAYSDKHGVVVLYHVKNASKQEVPWISDDLIVQYVETNFDGKTESKSEEDEIWLNRTGHVFTENLQRYFSIKRCNHTIQTMQWTLSYATYTAKYVLGKRVREIEVYHSYTFDSLEKICHKLRMQTFEEVAIDLWLGGIIHGECVTIDRTKKIRGKDDVLAGYKGEYKGVYEGKVGGMKAAVKLFPADHKFSAASRLLWSRTTCKYILPFRGMQFIERQYRVAFERCTSSLYEFSCNEVRLRKFGAQIFSSLLEGLVHLHTLGISHGCLNPWNILVSCDGTVGEAKISGFGSFALGDEKELFEEKIKKDRRDLGRLIVYCHHKTKGGICREEQYLEDSMADKAERNNMYAWAAGAKDFADFLLDEGKSLAYMCDHSYIWLGEKRLNYIGEANQHFQMLSPTDKSAYEAEMLAMRDQFYVGQNWISQVPKLVISKSVSTYRGAEPSELLRFMRNSLHHYGKLSDDVKYDVKSAKRKRQDAIEFIGSNNVQLEHTFYRKFPKFLPALHRYLRGKIGASDLRNGFLSRFYMNA